MTCMSCTTERTPSLYLSNEMPPSTCCKYFTFFHSSISHSPLQPTAQLNNSYHLSLRFYNLNKWWVLDIPCCGLIYLLPLKLRLTIIINDNFFLLPKVNACNWVSFAKKDSKCHFRGNPKARWLNWNYCRLSPCEHNLLWSSWVGSKKAALLESRQTFEVAAAQTSGPVNLVLSLQTGFFECSIHLFEFIDKPMVTTKTSVASAQLLGLGSKLYPSDMLRMFNKDLSQFMQSLSKYAKIRQA